MVKYHWKFQSKEQAVVVSDQNTSNFILISDNDRTILKLNLLEATLRQNDFKIIQFFMATLKHIVRWDFPHKWPELVSQINGYLS
jgi:hypothetical protein